MVSERIQKHLDRLHAARTRLDAALDSVPAPLWEQPIYADGAQWTGRQLLIHLMLADAGHNAMVTNAAQGINIIPEDYDIERYNRGSVGKRGETSVEQARAGLAASRAQMIDWLHGLASDEVLDKQGRHASLAIMSIAQILNVMARHEDGHAGDIENWVAAGG